MANTKLSDSIPEHTRITPERALMIKTALIRQYVHQYNLEVTGWEEIVGGTITKYAINENFEVVSVEVRQEVTSKSSV